MSCFARRIFEKTKKKGATLTTHWQLSEIPHRRTSHWTLGLADGAVCTSRPSGQIAVVRAEYRRRIRRFHSIVGKSNSSPIRPDLILPPRPY